MKNEIIILLIATAAGWGVYNLFSSPKPKNKSSKTYSSACGCGG